MIAWFLTFGLASADPLMDALAEELDRSTRELQLGEHGPPYYVGYDLFDVWSTSVEAVLGGVVATESRPSRNLGVAVRVGSPELDSANFQASYRAEDGHRSRRAVVGDDPYALRHTAWYETDRAYKDAIENLSRRMAARDRKASNGDEAPCFGPGEAQQSTEAAADPVSVGDLEPIAVALSEVFVDYPDLEWSRVYTSAEAGRRIHVDSLGTRVIKPEAELNVRVVARARAQDGSQATDHASWLVSTVDDLPSLDKMKAQARLMAERLVDWRELEIPEEDYVGPVLFEGPAAIEIARTLLVPALSGTPSPEKPPKGTRTFSFGGDSSDAVRVKRRLLPAGFHVRDDPTANPGLPSSYTFDDEGTRAQVVDLVVDGVVRTHYASRTPSKEVPVSNGHARGGVGPLMRATASFTTVEVDKGLNDKKIHKLALSQAAAYELDHYVVIRRLEDPQVAGAGVAMFVFGGGGDEGPLKQPLVAERVYADGHTEPFRGTRFVGVDHRSLRDVVAAGTEPNQKNVLVRPPGAMGSGPMYGVPVTLRTPDLLFGEMELSVGGGGGEKPPALPSPLAKQ